MAGILSSFFYSTAQEINNQMSAEEKDKQRPVNNCLQGRTENYFNA